LSSVEPVDINNDRIVDYIYAGDLFGNLWKFDVTDSNPSNWTVVKGNSNNPKPLFVATDDLGNRQPITSQPVIGLHPEKTGYIVNFGTGKYLELTDLQDTGLQTFYGVWDRDEANITTIGRSNLYPQTIDFTNTQQFDDFNARVTSNGSFDFYDGNGLPSGNPATYLGWRMDLWQREQSVDDSVTPPVDEIVTPENWQKLGERVVYRPTRRSGRIIFTTVIPSSNPCSAGGESWLMEISATTGARLTETPFDYNNDGVFNAADLVAYDGGNVPGGGIQDKDGGKTSRAMILVDEKGDEQKIISKSTGDLIKVKESASDQGIGRRSWIQIIPQ
jgi:type IV pilus assembly protein PilY1